MTTKLQLMLQAIQYNIYDRTRHVEVDRNFIKEKLDVKINKISFVQSEDQFTDVLIKTFNSRIFYSSLSKLGMEDIYAPT